MRLVYASKTRNIEKFITKLEYKHCYKIENTSVLINEPFILLTYTTGLGEIPLEITAFLKNNHTNLQYIIGSGNRNWGSNYCKAAYTLADTYNIPILMTFELSGGEKDILKLKGILKNLK